MNEPNQGRHLLLDLHEASGLADMERIEQALRDAAAVIGATLLDIKLHKFTGAGGITGVATLAESHISIHTWPERAFAAIDIFVCGDLDPADAVGVLDAAFRPGQRVIKILGRGKPGLPELA
ncbi:MAG: adenosylmethionine decarboxylase [Pseudomonadota bacterium]